MANEIKCTFQIAVGNDTPFSVSVTLSGPATPAEYKDLMLRSTEVVYVALTKQPKEWTSGYLRVEP